MIVPTRIRLIMKYLIFFLISFNLFARVSIKQESTQNLLSLFKSNEALLMAFIRYDSKLIQKEAEKTLTHLNMIKDLKLTRILKDSNKFLKKLVKSTHRKEQNYLYSLFSIKLIRVLKTISLPGKYNVYYCPMKKKSWIQNSSLLKIVNNPYASSMPHCGVQKTNYSN